MSEQNRFVENCLLENLKSVDVPATQESEGIRLGRGTPTLFVQDVEVWLHDNQQTWLAHIEVAFALNPERADSYLYDCATGWGDSAETAMTFAANAVCQTSVPPVLSLLNSKEVLGAEYISVGDEYYGFPDWEAFTSPYILRGEVEAGQKLAKYAQETTLSSIVAPVLEEVFDRPMLNTVRLYLGFDGTNYHAECRVNNKISESGKRVILNANLPNLNAFASINQFFLLLHKQDQSS